MADYLLNTEQLEVIKDKIEFENKVKLAYENWNSFNEEEKEFVVESLKFLYPEKFELIKEAKWYNTLGDIIGIVDPTGVVDFVNGISYIAQGDQLFGFLSLISAIPIAGDAVAKPVMSALKVGGPSAKGLKNVMALTKAGDTARAASELARISKTDGLVAKFVRGFGGIAGKLKEMILRSPGGIFKGLKNTILQWIEVFEKGAVAGRVARRSGRQLAAKFGKLTQAERLTKLKELKKATDAIGFFKTYRTPGKLMSWKTFWGGMPQLMGRNKSIRALMRKSKWWLGFLDYVGIGNWVGPEEFKEKFGADKMEEMIKKYQQTPESQRNFADEYGGDVDDTQDIPQSEVGGQTQSQSSGDPLQQMIQSLVLGRLKGTALGAM